MVTLTKMLIELASEVTNVFVTYTLTYDEVWTIMCFSAMTLIGAIDAQFFAVLANDKVKK